MIAIPPFPPSPLNRQIPLSSAYDISIKYIPLPQWLLEQRAYVVERLQLLPEVDRYTRVQEADSRGPHTGWAAR